MRDSPTVSVALVRRALAREREAERLLVEALTPSIRASVGRVLRRSAVRGSAPHDADDITQSVLLFLFSDGGRVLLGWDPERGLGLEGFVALVARRRAVSILRGERREDPTESRILDEHVAETAGPELAFFSRRACAAVVETVSERLSRRGAKLFELLFLRGFSTEEVCALEGMTAGAVYGWKSRLSRLVHQIADEMAASSDHAA